MQTEKVVKEKIAVILTYRLFAKSGMFQDYKSCFFCGQNKIPFKKGVCPKCCNQVGDVRYVKDPRKYVKSNYGAINVDEIGLHAKGDPDEK